MILPDTSVWVDHLRRKDQALQAQLDDRSVLVHPFVIGEVALGHVAHRAEVLLRLHWLRGRWLRIPVKFFGLSIVTN